MPTPIEPQDQWETDFEGPLPGEPGRSDAFRELIQKILNRTERLKNLAAAIMGVPFGSTPPTDLQTLKNRADSVEASIDAHRTNPILDHPDGSITTEKIADGAVASSKLAPVRDAPLINPAPGDWLLGGLEAGTGVGKVPIGQANGITLLNADGMPITASGNPVIAYGYNSNGYYIRFADGTQLCWAEQPSSVWASLIEYSTVVSGVTIYYKDLIGVTFPAAFIATPIIVVGGDVFGPQLENIVPWSPSTTSFNMAANYQLRGSNIYSHYIAIGRWY